MKLIKELKGFSGSQVLLIQDPDVRVRKIGNVDRNLERFASLDKLGIALPKLLTVGQDMYDMEYIPNLDVKNFLVKNPVHHLAQFITALIKKFQQTSTLKDYSQIYESKLSQVDFTGLKFNQQQLIDKLPKLLPQSEYHGDLTLENILYAVDRGEFVLIDPLTSVYDSWVFDLAKLRQDIVSHWFIRNDQLYLEPKLKALDNDLGLFETWNNEYILIAMLLRVLPYASGQDRAFIIREANKLWK